MDRIGIADCPDCGMIDLVSISQVVVYMPKGISRPMATIACTKCQETFLSSLTWENACMFDEMGCTTIGFSKRTMPLITNKEIVSFMQTFDKWHEDFLNIIDEEIDGRKEPS